MKTLQEIKSICESNDTCATCPFYYAYADGPICYFSESDTPNTWDFVAADSTPDENNQIMYSVQLPELYYSNDLFTSIASYDCLDFVEQNEYTDYRIAKILVNSCGIVLEELEYITEEE